MSQHLVDSGQRVFTDHDDAHRDVPNDAGGDRGGHGATRLGSDGGSGAGEGRGAGEREPGARDATLDALDALSDALNELGNDQRLLERRLRELHRQRSAGRAWREILAEEDGPGTLQVVSRMLACLAKASGTLRKELVDALRREGVSIPAIAKLFGVTHQRVSNLLRRPSE